MYFEMMKNIYRLIIPNRVRKRVSQYRVVNYLEKQCPNGEIKEILEYMKANEVSCFPYAFAKKYNWKNVAVYRDVGCPLHYVILHGKKMYLKKSMSEEAVKRYVTGLMVEQDPQSPHRYIEAATQLCKEDMVMADLGAAEGSFALSVVDQCSKIYLFECDPAWIEPLQMTFLPWKEKVVLINKFVGAQDFGNHITLDTYFKDKEIDYIKADIEGAELDLLVGGRRVIREKVSQVVLCAYHAADAEKKIEEALLQYKYTISTAPGYMVWNDDRDKRKSGIERYLRRGVIYGIKELI